METFMLTKEEVENLEIHPAALIYPPMSEKELDDLAKDISTNGLLSPIGLLDNRVLDGRNRLEGCKRAKKRPKFIKVKTKEPLAYTRSHNKRRRHLTGSQRARLVVKEMEYLGIYPGERPLVEAELIERAGVSKRTVQRVRSVGRHGAPTLQKALDTGAVSAKVAEQISKLPMPQQAAVLKKHKDQPKRPKKAQMGRETVGAQGVQEARKSLGGLVKILSSIGLFEPLYDHLEAIRLKLDGV